MLTTHFHLMPRLRMNGAIPLYSDYTPSWRTPLTSRLAVQAWTNDPVTENSSVCRLQVFRRPPVYIPRLRTDTLSEDLDRFQYDMTRML
jgi:hypothetical protein